MHPLSQSIENHSIFMDYNTGRPKLVFREYGRHIQKLVDKAVEIEDDELRNKVTKTIIDMMGIINPHLKNVEDYKHKLWDHIFMISDFKLKVDSPYPIPSAETLKAEPLDLPYPKGKLKYKHYGKNVETMIAKAVDMEDAEKKHEYALCIANYMKMVYLNWNSEDVTDDHIKSDLKVLSNDKLDLGDDALNVMKAPSRQRSNTKKRTGGRNQKGGGRRHSKNSSRNSRGRSGGRSGGRRNYSR